jgi:hypothetical protein
VPGRRPFSRLFQVHDRLVGHCFFQDISGRVPVALFDLAEIPGMTFAAGEIAARLINGEVVLRTREVNGSDEPVYPAFIMLQGRAACGQTLPVYLDQAASRLKTLLFQATLGGAPGHPQKTP